MIKQNLCKFDRKNVFCTLTTGENMFTDYYRQQGAFPQSYCSMRPTPSGSILETEILGEIKMWSEK